MKTLLNLKEKKQKKKYFIIIQGHNLYKKTKEIKSSSRSLIEKILEDSEKDLKNITNTKEEIKSKNDKKQKTDSLSRFTMDSEGRVIDEKGNILTKVYFNKNSLLINLHL